MCGCVCEHVRSGHVCLYVCVMGQAADHTLVTLTARLSEVCTQQGSLNRAVQRGGEGRGGGGRSKTHQQIKG